MATIRRPFKTFTPFGSLVTLDVHVDEGSAVVMPKGVQDPTKTLTATVVAAGPTCVQCKVGDVVLLQENAVSRVYPIYHGDSPRVYVIREDQVLGIADR